MHNKKHKSRIVSILVFTTIILMGLSVYFGTWYATKDFIEEGIIIQEGEITYKKYLTNYYDVDYEKTKKGIELKINNPCLGFVSSKGSSMKPFFECESLEIIDTCFPKDKLEIGDIIMYHAEWDVGFNLIHRIIDIDYDKKWVRTQGDNNEEPDDFVSFNRIYGKIIGVLNVLEDKKIVKEEIIEFNKSMVNLNFSTFNMNFTIHYAPSQGKIILGLNKSEPFMIIDCGFYLEYYNQTNWTNANLSLRKNNTEVLQLNLEEYCN